MSVQARCFFLLLIFSGSFLYAQKPIPIPPLGKGIVKFYNSDLETLPVITALDIDPSGQFMAVGGDDHLVRLKNVDTGQSWQFREQLDWVRGITFSDDRTLLIIVGQNGQMEIHNAHTGSLIRKIQGETYGIQAVAFRPNGKEGKKEFAICGFLDDVLIYNALTGQLVHNLKFKAHDTNNRAIRFSPDGTLLAVAGRSGITRIWNAETGKKIHDLRGDGRRVNALAFNPSGTWLAIAGEGPNITLWNMKNNERRDLSERIGKTFSLEFCGENLLASGESDNVIRLWDIESKTCFAHTIDPDKHHGTIAVLVYDSINKKLISGSFDTTVRSWSIPSKPLELERGLTRLENRKEPPM